MQDVHPPSSTNITYGNSFLAKSFFTMWLVFLFLFIPRHLVVAMCEKIPKCDEILQSEETPSEQILKSEENPEREKILTKDLNEYAQKASDKIRFGSGYFCQLSTHFFKLNPERKAPRDMTGYKYESISRFEPQLKVFWVNLKDVASLAALEDFVMDEFEKHGKLLTLDIEEYFALVLTITLALPKSLLLPINVRLTPEFVANTTSLSMELVVVPGILVGHAVIVQVSTVKVNSLFLFFEANIHYHPRLLSLMNCDRYYYADDPSTGDSIILPGPSFSSGHVVRYC
ncbi:S ribonuclease [Striga asiatica]|uniref:S ribonuclease n=1 Tax=Striga asiatica TaxID=4170 RepID=A0A5A7P956_STRAF|nr:S ribonuclease [Striga asiatica]